MNSLSLKVQITFLVILLIAGLVGAFSWNVITEEKNMIISELYRTVILQARNIALSSSKPLLHRDPEFELHPLITRVRQSDKNIISIAVMNRKGTVQASSDLMMIDKEYTLPRGLSDPEKEPDLLEGESLRESDDIVFISIPVMAREEKIGSVSMEYSKQEAKSTVFQIYSRMLRIGIIAVIIGSVISIALSLYIARPVKKLETGAKAIGRGELNTRIDISSVKELKVLADSFNDMAFSLKKHRRALIENERIQKELELAHEIQSTLLPTHLPQPANFEIDAFYKPAAQVGGDYYDLFALEGEKLMLAVGDVSGKGVPGLVVMAMVRILIRGLAAGREGPATMLRKLNVLLKRNMKKHMFVTLFCGLIDLRNGEIVLSSAAHMPLFLYRRREDKVVQLRSSARPLGIFDDSIFSKGVREEKIKLHPGDLLFQFTDGLSEIRNGHGEEFGLARIDRMVREAGRSGAGSLISELRKEYDAFRGEQSQPDDLTMLAINYLPAEVPEDRCGGEYYGAGHAGERISRMER
jgi:serine phosphatase RsbU (regulator of sigma subunit)